MDSEAKEVLQMGSVILFLIAMSVALIMVTCYFGNKLDDAKRMSKAKSKALVIYNLRKLSAEKL